MDERAILDKAVLQEMEKMSREVEVLRYKLNRLESQPPQAATPATDFKVADPDFFNGSKSKVKFFLLQLNLYFQAQSKRFASDDNKIIFAADFLRAEALSCFEQESSSSPKTM